MVDTRNQAIQKLQSRRTSRQSQFQNSGNGIMSKKRQQDIQKSKDLVTEEKIKTHTKEVEKRFVGDNFSSLKQAQTYYDAIPPSMKKYMTKTPIKLYNDQIAQIKKYIKKYDELEDDYRKDNKAKSKGYRARKRVYENELKLIMKTQTLRI